MNTNSYDGGMPTARPLTILCRLGVHRGLGHQVRQSAILGALESEVPNSRIHVQLPRGASCPAGPASPQPDPTSGEIAGRPTGRLYETVLGDPDSASSILEAYHRLSPDLLLFDTFLPRERPPARLFPNGHPPTVVLTLRKVFPDRLRGILSSEWMEWVRLLLVPHDASEFLPRIPSRFHTKVVQTGRIVRRFCAENSLSQSVTQRSSVHDARVRLGLSPTQPFILATTGGGGIPAYFERFQNCVFTAFEQARRCQPRLRLVFVTGPQNVLSRTAPDGCHCVPFEPALPLLMGEADLVIAHTGYNTTQEIIEAGTPAVFLPMVTKYDDGLARSRHCRALGIAEVVEDLDPNTLGQFLQRYVSERELRSRMRGAFAQIPRSNGAEIASQAIADLGRRRSAELRDVERKVGCESRQSAPLQKTVEHRRHPLVLAYSWIGESPQGPGEVDAETFRSQLRWLSKFTRVSSLSDLAESFLAAPSAGQSAVVLTFDYAYRDTMGIVLPLLQEFGVKATFFLPTGYLGRWDAWNAAGSHCREHIDWNDVEFLLRAGHTIGVHGRNQHALTKFDRDELKKELRRSIRDVETAVGICPRYVAYPHDAANDLTLRIASKIFTLGFTGESGDTERKRGMFFIPRLRVRPFWTLSEFAHNVHHSFAVSP